MSHYRGKFLLMLVTAVCLGSPVVAAEKTGSITDRSIDWPSAEQWLRVLSLRDYNTRVVVLGTMVLGIAAGVIGAFMLLRKRSLLGDALSHATLPGIGLAFIFVTLAGGTGKSLPMLLLGATVTGALGAGAVLFIDHFSRLKQDTALGIVLSVFFGAGVSVLGIVQKMQTGHAAGLESFIYGKTASMLASDAMLIAVTATIVVLVCTLFFKEFKLLCFDAGFARSQGWPTVLLDILMMALVIAVTVIGLQAVGLILIIALLIIPPAAARFWTDRLPRMILISALIGAASGVIGAAMSALLPNLPSGAMIVVVAAAIFSISMLFGPARGVLVRAVEHWRLTATVARQNLLRAAYELCENQWADRDVPRRLDPRQCVMAWDQLLAARSWPPRELRRLLRDAERLGFIAPARGEVEQFRLTEEGLVEALRVTRNHRLWEQYLISYADIAPGRVDRDAEQVEHILGTRMVAELERLMLREYPHLRMPSSPHPLTAPRGSS